MYLGDFLGEYKLGPNDENQGIYLGDARQLLRGIPDETVDLILTDPPYLKEYLDCYDWLGSEASRILKDGGWCLVYGAGEHLLDHINRLTKYLDYFWVFVLHHTGATPRMWVKKLMSGYKPVLAFTKGKPRILRWKSTVHTGDTQDKRYHVWGQSIGFVAKMIELHTQQRDIVVDPFCGGGTTPAACKELNRRWLAFEIDAKTHEVAQQRVKDVQPMLFVPEYQQIEMFEEIQDE